MDQSQWSVYLVRCANGSLYTGIATDVSRRLKDHQQANSKGAKYLRGKGPLCLVFQKKIGAKGLTLRVESSIKKLSKALKEALVEQDHLIDEIINEAQSDSVVSKESSSCDGEYKKMPRETLEIKCTARDSNPGPAD